VKVQKVYNFDDVPTVRKFYLSDKKIRAIIGPYGSGKSSGCVITLLKVASEQQPDPEGVRYTRFVIIRNCYSDDTEILTEQRGWVLFKDLLSEDKVAQYNPSTDRLEFVYPIYYYCAPYEGRMIGVRSDEIDFLVTPDHKLFVRTKDAENYSLVFAKDCFGTFTRFMCSPEKEVAINPSQWRAQFYKGFVYCVEVPSHVVLVRRNGKPVLCSQTYRQLKDTTKKTIDEWLSFAEWKESEHSYTIHVQKEDGTIIHSEWLLRALDRPEHIANLLSLEVTAGWINEAREIPKEIFDNLESRLRYPPTIRDSEGNVIYGPTWSGILLDTNPPDTDHWFYKYFEEDRPEKAEIFHQPSGLSPEAENINNLPQNYYEDLVTGKDPEWIDIYVHGKYGSLREGMPVFTLYNDKVHCAKEPLAPLPGMNTLIIGMDFGLTPAAVITQQPPGRLLVLDEVVVFEPIDIGEFTRMFLLPFLSSEKYKFKHYIIIGDPAGRGTSQTDGRTCFQVLNQLGIRAYPAFSNSIQLRINAVNQYLSRIDPSSGEEARPAFLLSPTCITLRKALKTKYKLKKISIGGERYATAPVKDKYSHVADALQYAALGHTINSINTRTDLPVRDSSPTRLAGTGYY